MSQIFVTGTTGYIGAYVAKELFERSSRAKLHLLVRAKSTSDAYKRLWQAWQMHMPFDQFQELVQTRARIYLGDITEPKLGISPEDYAHLVKSIDSVIHCAASLNRKSEKACLNTNLRGTLHVLQAAQAANVHHGLRRFSDISTVAVAGEHKDDFMIENAMINWSLSDYDPYARTKKFCEYMVHELLPDVSKVVFRPSIVLGDSRFPQTTQFDMVKAFVWLSNLPALPFDPQWRLDIVNVDFVAAAIAKIHLKDAQVLESYNLSAGSDALTFKEISRALASNAGKHAPLFLPFLEPISRHTVHALANTPRFLGLGRAFSLLKVFWPYLTFNTVFDNSRAVAELGYGPVPFSSYAQGLRAFALKGKFTYPYKPWPETPHTPKTKVA